ncbi:MAG: hypothetical protein Q9166_008089 [cf. Caloplaca sp. 2 TL-2023]
MFWNNFCLCSETLISSGDFADLRRPPLKAAEVLQHPKFGHTTLKLDPDQKGKVHVAKHRGGPFNIAYEVHGSGPRHLVFIMGLGTFKTAWQRQMQYFGHEQGSQYSCLIFDNRGMGESDKPLARYSTSEMAKDTLELIDSIGWTSPRQLHVIGVSMGGMIAQELDSFAITRINRSSPSEYGGQSLATENTSRIKAHESRDTGKTYATGSICCTFKGVLQLEIYLPGFSIPKSPDVQLDDMKARMFSQSWLEAPDEYGDFPTNGDRFAAMELKKRQDVEGFTRKGFICQAIAAGWHHKSPEQLKELADKVGRQRIQVWHGTLDNMITVPHGETLSRELGEDEGVSKIIVNGRGHVLHMEEKKMYHEVLQRMVEKTENLG